MSAIDDALANAILDAATIEEFVNGDPGTVTARLGKVFNNLAKISADIALATANPPVEHLYRPVGDETTNITVGTGKLTFRMPYAFQVTEVRISLAAAQASGTIFTADLKEAGVSIFSTKPTIDNGSKTSVGAATPAVISDALLADNAEMTVDVTQIGAAGAKGLKVLIIGRKVSG